MDSDQNGGHFQKVIIGHAELKWLEDALSRLFLYAETGIDRQLFTYIGVYGGTILSNVAMLLGPLVDQRPTNKSVITTEVKVCNCGPHHKDDMYVLGVQGKCMLLNATYYTHCTCPTG